MRTIRELFIEKKEKGEKALIAYMMAVLPNQNQALEAMKTLEDAGCDILELGFPYSDPLADGEKIEAMHHQGVKQGIKLDDCLEFTRQLKTKVKMPIVIFTYFNLIYRRGPEKFCQELKEIGIEAMIVPDLPLDERQRIEQLGIELIPMIAPSSTEKRMAEIGKLDPSFIYCVSVRGTTGKRELPVNEINDYLAKIKEHTTAPLALGFGISKAEQIKSFKEEADAFVVGSHLAEIINQYSNEPAKMQKVLGEEFHKLKIACCKS